MALVRVYCGLASADTGVAGDDGWLTAAVVDDSGRLLDVCEIGDDANGYATLSALLAERSSAPSGVAVAADSDDHLLTMLLTTAGRSLAVADDDAADDFAERFADDDSADEIESAPAERRAVGLARALQAGALSAQAGPAPRDLAGLKPVLAAHTALAYGRHGTAGALREVLRELYPAALRAYPDPAEHLSLAILDVLPEPGMLAAPAGRGREVLTVDSVAAQVATAGVTDHATATEAVTALRVAIAETPRRGGVSKQITAAIAETVRQAVAAVRACDAACASLIQTIADRVSSPGAAAPVPPPAKPLRRTAAAPASAPPAATLPAPVPMPLRPVREEVQAPTRIPASRRARSPLNPVAAAPVSPAPVAPVAPLPPGFEPTPAVGVPVIQPPRQPQQVSQPAHPRPVAQPKTQPQPVATTTVAQPQPQPVQGGTAAVPAQRGPIDDGPRTTTPAEVGAPFVPTLSQAAIHNARAERLTSPGEPAGSALDEQGAGIGATEIVLPLTRPAPSAEPAGSRSSWPLIGDRDERAAVSGPPAYEPPAYQAPYEPVGFDRGYEERGYEERGYERDGRGRDPRDRDVRDTRDPLDVRDGRDARDRDARDRDARDRDVRDRDGRGRNGYDRGYESGGFEGSGFEANGYEANGYGANGFGPNGYEANGSNGYEANGYDTGGYDKVTPPWLADDLVLPEPPPLRLVDASALEEPLSVRAANRGGSPVVDDGDGDLLIFSTIRSAWFTGHPEGDAPEDNGDEPTWNSEVDLGWRAAESAASPSFAEETRAGLPKRVPQANLVPGSPITTPDRSLRIVRDPQRLAQHTSGYFRGWRRGQEVNGYAVGGRPGRESAGGWDFSRDTDDREDYGYRTANYGR